MVKPAKDSFDPKIFLAKVGAGKSISKFSKGQNVFAQGDVADAVFYIQKGKLKLTVVSDQGKEAIVGILEPGQFLWRRSPQRSSIAHCHYYGNGGLRHHGDIEDGDDYSARKQAEILSIVYGVSACAQ